MPFLKDYFLLHLHQCRAKLRYLNLFAWKYVLSDLDITIIYSSSYIAVFESYSILENGTKFSISENGMITTEISNFVPFQ